MRQWKRQALAMLLVGALTSQTAVGAIAQGRHEVLRSPEEMRELPETCLEEENAYTCTSLEDAIRFLREQVTKRANHVTIVVPGGTYQDFAKHAKEQGITAAQMEDILANYIEIEAFRNDDDPKWGDGAYFSFRTQGSNVYFIDNYIYIEYYYQYRLTAEQEREMDIAVAQVVKELNLTQGTDYEKIRRIYRYICDNVTYDYPHLHDDNYYLQYTAYAALLHKTAVCEGYALLLYRLAKEAGLECRIGLGGDQVWEEYGDPEAEWEGHAWNLVALDGMYYFLDATWDAGKPESEYEYFLKGTLNFSNVPFHQLVMGAAEHTETAIRNQLIMMEHPLSLVDYNGMGSIQDPLQAMIQQQYEKALLEAQQRKE